MIDVYKRQVDTSQCIAYHCFFIHLSYLLLQKLHQLLAGLHGRLSGFLEKLTHFRVSSTGCILGHFCMAGVIAADEVAEILQIQLRNLIHHVDTSYKMNMPPDGSTTIQESQLLRTFGAPAAAAVFVIRAAALLTHCLLYTSRCV